MREVRFRAWDTENKNYLIDGFFIRPDGKVGSYTDRVLGVDLLVEQFTGLKDKNGRDIYEGDTVSGVDRYFIEPVTGVVEFHGMSFVFNGKTKSGQKWLFTVSADNISSLYEIEVTGNIHQAVQNGPT